MKNANGMMKWVIWVAAALITLGAMGEVIRSNRGRLDKVEPKVETNSNVMIGMQKDIQHIKEGVDELRKR